MISSFLHRFEKFGDDEAVVFSGTTYSYRELLELIADWRLFLDDAGIASGDIVAIEGISSAALCAGLLALIERGTVIVPLTPLPAAKRADFLQLAEVEIVVTVSEPGERTLTRTSRTAGHELYRRLRAAGSPGLVLFSSGTTGRSKASVLDFTKVLARYGEPTRPMRIMSFLNLDHIGGINTLLHTLSQGGTVVTVADRTPENVFATIARHRVQVLPTTPTFLNMALIAGVPQRFDTSSLSLVTYGTEPMPPQTLKRLAEALPHVRLKQTYGLSELGILPTRSRGDDSLWVRIGGSGFDYKIIDRILWIRSDMAMLGYLNAPAPFDADGYFNTQDEVEMDGEWLRILGRRSEVINVGGEKVYPSEVEDVLLQIPNVADATVSGHPSAVTGMVVMAKVRLVEEEDERTFAARARQFCLERLEPFKVPALVRVSSDAHHSDRFKKVRSAS